MDPDGSTDFSEYEVTQFGVVNIPALPFISRRRASGVGRFRRCSVLVDVNGDVSHPAYRLVSTVQSIFSEKMLSKIIGVSCWEYQNLFAPYR